MIGDEVGDDGHLMTTGIGGFSAGTGNHAREDGYLRYS